MKSPQISVIMATYNHAPYVVEAINSVLDQDFKDIEFLIADDGSKDGTADAVESVSDPRIQFTRHSVNRGAGEVGRELILKATGKYLALMNSDDVWRPGKLSYQFELLESSPEYAASFGRAAFIDNTGAGVSKNDLPFGTVFDQENRSRGQWLRHFFTKGNCICHPTMLIRREVFKNHGIYDSRLRQLPDYEMWVRLAKHLELHVSDRAMIDFRVLPGESASADTPRNAVRVINEYMLIIERFFDGVSRETLIDGFGDLLKIPSVPSPAHLEIEKVFLLFTPAPWLDHMYKIVGISKIYALMGSELHRNILQVDYKFGEHEFHALAGQADAFRPLPK
jgi:glycosyltransferase involved in cell wall biosynthesis